MAPVLRPAANLADLRAAAACHMPAFLAEKDHLHYLIYPTSDPPTSAQLDDIAARTSATIEKERSAGAESAYWLVVDDVTAEVMGGARWVFWTGDKQYDTPTVAKPESEAFVGGHAKARVQYLQWAFNEYYKCRGSKAKGPHAMLELCYTSADHRRKGVGKLLVEAGTRRADELGIPCFVEAVRNGTYLYASCGFTVVEVVAPEPQGGLWEGRPGWTGYSFDWMQRPAHAS